MLLSRLTDMVRVSPPSNHVPMSSMPWSSAGGQWALGTVAVPVVEFRVEKEATQEWQNGQAYVFE